MIHKYTDQFQLRMPSGLRDKIKAAAKLNMRSMNAEISLCLIATFGDGATETQASKKVTALVR